MSEITTRSGKGLPLTHDEVDANFTNLNTDKYESGDVAQFNKVTVKNESTLSAGNAEVIFEYQAESLGKVYGASGAAGGTGINNSDNSSGVFAFNNGAVSVFTPTSSRVVPDLQVNSSGNVSVKNNLTVTSGDLTVTAGDLTVDTDTLFVDASANAVGIGEDANLDAALVVRGGNYTFNADDGLLIQSGDSTANHIRAGFKLKSNGSGVYKTVIEAASTVGGDLTDGTTIDVLNIDVTGNIAIPVGNGDGKGITFNSTTANAATTLDYYEEGEWTPVLSDALTGGNTATAATARGRYTRIGNVVHCTLELTDIDTTGMTGTNSLRLQGLPFVGKGDVVNRVAISYWNDIDLGANAVGMSLSITNNETYATFNAVRQSAGLLALPVQNLTSGSADMGTVFTYLTST